jgi:hypothetical protein
LIELKIFRDLDRTITWDVLAAPIVYGCAKSSNVGPRRSVSHEGLIRFACDQRARLIFLHDLWHVAATRRDDAVIIDRTHRTWIVGSCLVFAAATAWYAVYTADSPDGPSGASPSGMAFGIIGLALMIATGLLSLRKRLPRWAIGTAARWLKAHLYLGLLSVPLILFHAGFRLGGPLEMTLMIVFALIVVSGLMGVALQQYLPRVMKSTITAETAYDQIPSVCRSLRGTADEAVSSVCGGLFETDGADDPQDDLRHFYVRQVRPFLVSTDGRGFAVANASQASALFAQIRTRLPESFHETVSQLSTICHERRHLVVQRRMHHWLHAWLLLHIPLSMTLLVLGLAHAIMSLYY